MGIQKLILSLLQPLKCLKLLTVPTSKDNNIEVCGIHRMWLVCGGDQTHLFFHRVCCLVTGADQ